MDTLRLSKAPPTPRAPSSRRPIVRRLMGSLLAYHALILAGAFLIVVAGGWGVWRDLGIALVVLGISVEVAIVLWTASLARSPAGGSPTRPGPPASSAPGESSRICFACGHRGDVSTRICPQCGRPMVSRG